MAKRKCYCAFCKHERIINTQKTISAINLLLCALVAVAMGFIVWNQFDPKTLIIFAGILIMSEIFIKIKWRFSMVCPHCSFDPILYLKDHKKAADRVKIHLDGYKEKNIENPMSVAKKNPFKNLALKKLNRSRDIDITT